MPENPEQATDETTEQPTEAAQSAETDWKAEARKWEQRAKDNKAKLDEAAPIVEQWRTLEEASKSDLERAQQETSRWQQDAESWRKAAVGSRIEALAANDFADPSDAVAALADKNYLDAGGQIDADAIRNDLAAVLERKPHYRKADAGPVAPRVPAPNPHQGNGSNPAPGDPAQQFASIVRSHMGSG